MQRKINVTENTPVTCCKNNNVPDTCSGLCKVVNNIGSNQKQRSLSDIGSCTKHFATINKCTSGDLITGNAKVFMILLNLKIDFQNYNIQI